MFTIGLDEYLVFGVNAPGFSHEIFNPCYSGCTCSYEEKISSKTNQDYHFLWSIIPNSKSYIIFSLLHY